MQQTENEPHSLSLGAYLVSNHSRMLGTRAGKETGKGCCRKRKQAKHRQGEYVACHRQSGAVTLAFVFPCLQLGNLGISQLQQGVHLSESF